MQSKSLINYWNPGSFFDNVRGLYFDVNANGGGDGAGTGSGGEPPAPQTKAYTQEQLDQMFADRAKRGGESALSELYKALGVKDGNELTALFNEGKKLKESQQSDMDKLNKDKADAEKALTDEKTAHDATRKGFIERLLKAEVLSAAKKAGFRDESLGDVWMLVNTAEQRTKITEKDDAFVGVEAVVDEIKKAKPFWLAQPEDKRKTPGSPKQPRKPGDNTPEPTMRKVKTL